MVYEIPTEIEKLDQLRKELNMVRDILFFSNAKASAQQKTFGVGRKANNLGSEVGGKSFFPIETPITEIDEDDVATGVFDKLNLQSLTTVVSGTASTILLKFIQGLGDLTDGKFFTVTPKTGKSLKLQAGGDLAIPADITITDKEFAVLQYYADTGKVKCVSGTGGAAGGGGLSEPIIHSIKNYGSAGSPVTTDQDIDLSLTTGNAHRIYLGANINITFSGFPAVDKLEPFEIILVQDATGGRTPTFTTGTIIGSTGIDETGSAISIKIVQTFDNGATFYMYDATGGTGGSGGTTSVPAGSAVNDHLEWDGSAWVAQQILEFGTVPADQGRIRAENNTIGLAWRNALNDGNLEFKVDASDFFDLTDSSNGAVTLVLRAQHAVDADKTLTITQSSGATGTASFNSGTKLAFDIGATNVMEIVSSGLEMLGGLDIEMNQGQIQNLSALVFEGFATDGRSISEFATGIHYDIENAAHSHVFRVSGATPAIVLSIGTNGLTMAKDIIMADNSITGLNAVNFTDSGGQIAASAVAPHLNFVLTGASLFRFTTNAFDILDIDDANGLTMLGTHGIKLGNNNLSEINQLEFNESGQTIEDGVNGITHTVGAGDRHMFVVNAAEHFRVDDGLVDVFGSFVSFTERTAPATPSANQLSLYAKDKAGKSALFWKDDAGTEFDLTAASAVQKLITEGDSKVVVNDVGAGSVDIHVDNAATRKFWFTATELNLGSLSLSGLNQLVGKDTTNQLFSLSVGWLFSVDAADQFSFRFDTTEKYTFQDTLAIFGEDLRMEDQKGIRGNTGGFMYYTVGPTKPTTMGAASNVGALQIPYKADVTDSPSSATLNDWFGDQNGCIGLQFDNDAPDVFTFWAKLNGTWHKALLT